MHTIIIICLCFGSFLSAQTANLLQNPDFSAGLNSDGVPIGWRLDLANAAQGSAEVLPDQPMPGKFTLHLRKTSPEGSVNLTQTVKLKANTEYEYYARGRRNAAYRWHYFGIRCPGTRISKSGHLPHADTPSVPVRFRSDTHNTLCYVTLALWGREENKNDSIGEFWIEEVVLREVETPPAKIISLGNYFFPSDKLTGSIWLQNYSGQISIILSADQRELARLEMPVAPGNNPFKLPFRHAPIGKAKLEIKANEISVSQSIVIQKGIFP